MSGKRLEEFRWLMSNVLRFIFRVSDKRLEEFSCLVSNLKRCSKFNKIMCIFVVHMTTPIHRNIYIHEF